MLLLNCLQALRLTRPYSLSAYYGRYFPDYYKPSSHHFYREKLRSQECAYSLQLRYTKAIHIETYLVHFPAQTTGAQEILAWYPKECWLLCGIGIGTSKVIQSHRSCQYHPHNRTCRLQLWIWCGLPIYLCQVSQILPSWPLVLCAYFFFRLLVRLLTAVQSVDIPANTALEVSHFL